MKDQLQDFLKNFPRLSKDVIKGFMDGVRLGRAYLKTLGQSNLPIRPMNDKDHVDLDAYRDKPAYRKGTHIGVDSTLLTKDIGTYIKEGYTYDTGPKAHEVLEHDASKPKHK